MVGSSAYARSNCGWKSVVRPGTLYSYGPRCTSGGCSKLPCGGGDGAAHSSVVASHGFAPTFFPFFRLMKKLMMNGICATASIQAPHDETTFQCSAGCANW